MKEEIRKISRKGRRTKAQAMKEIEINLGEKFFTKIDLTRPKENKMQETNCTYSRLENKI